MARHLPAAVLLAAALAGAAVGAAGVVRHPAPRLTVEGPVWRYREGDLLYRFHATFRVETLFDAKEDPYETKDLSAARPADLAALRGAFLKRLRKPDLAGVPSSGEAWKHDLEANGYTYGTGR